MTLCLSSVKHAVVLFATNNFVCNNSHKNATVPQLHLSYSPQLSQSVCNLVNDTVSNLDCTVLNGWMVISSELERM